MQLDHSSHIRDTCNGENKGKTRRKGNGFPDKKVKDFDAGARTAVAFI